MLHHACSGHLPETWAGYGNPNRRGSDSHLSVLSLRSNQLSGQIPATWSQGSLIDHADLVDLSNNKLTGVSTSSYLARHMTRPKPKSKVRELFIEISLTQPDLGA